MRFLEPGFLILALPALLLWIGPVAAHRRVHAAIRTLVWLLVVFALARPVAERADDRSFHTVIIDRSASVTNAADDESRAWLDEAQSNGGARLTVVEIDGGDREPLSLREATQHLTIAASGATPLAGALDAAARSLPVGAAGSRITLLTDGLATTDSSGSGFAHALDDLGARGITVEMIPLTGAEGDLRVVGLSETKPARVGRETILLAQLVGGGQVVTCRLMGPDGELARVDGVQADGATSIPLRFTPDKAQFLDLTVTLEVTDGSDPVGGDLSFQRTLCVDAPLDVLYLGSRVQGGAGKLAELLGDGFNVTDGGASDSIGGADVVVLDDRPAKDVPQALQEEIIEAVTNGSTGLLASGGEASFGPGGYHEEPIEQLLPVEFVQKEEKRDPSTTLVVIIDTSGSMGGNRVQLAKEVSRLAIRRLLPHDKVGMVEFYGAKRWAVPIQPASNSIEIERALNRLDAGGGTVILPAIEEAYYGLKNVRTRFKHVLILTDGGVETGAFEPLLRRMADDGMNVSTVLIGPDAHSEFLVNIANWGQGRFYSVPNRFNLPEILLKQPASAKLPAYRPGIVNVRAQGGPSWWGDIDPEATPPVSGYVETRTRPGAMSLLETEDEGHPLLATWRYGAGRVTALTTELTGPGTESWSEWDGYGELLARTLERTAADDAEPFGWQLKRVPGGALVVAERRKPAGDSGADARGTIHRPSILRADRAAIDSLAKTAGELDRVAPDRFERFIPLAPDEGLRLSCGTSGRLPWRKVLALDPIAGGAREHQVSPDVADSLQLRFAALGSTPPAEPTLRRLREFAPLLALIALLLYLVDVAYRRWPRGL